MSKVETSPMLFSDLSEKEHTAGRSLIHIANSLKMNDAIRKIGSHNPSAPYDNGAVAERRLLGMLAAKRMTDYNLEQSPAGKAVTKSIARGVVKSVSDAAHKIRAAEKRMR
ncbi:MAG: hypothetical protein AAB573_05270 [Patescibacteria group bacterium]